jgi:hypothetical protein
LIDLLSVSYHLRRNFFNIIERGAMIFGEMEILNNF